MFVTAARYREAVAARDAAQEEVQYLRTQVAALQGHVFRLQRIQHGTTEVPMPRKERKPPAPWPGSLARLVEGFESAEMRRDLSGRIERMHAGGKNFETIEALLRKDYGLPEDEA